MGLSINVSSNPHSYNTRMKLVHNSRVMYSIITYVCTYVLYGYPYMHVLYVEYTL